MIDLQYHEDYSSDDELRSAFNAFLLDIHGLDLGPWEERVGWDEDFVHFSFFDRLDVVASTSVYVIPMWLDGQRQRVAQISSVGTRPAWRKKGLNAELTRRAMEWIGGQDLRGTFLFAADDAVGFYQKQGFVERPEHRHVLDAVPTGRGKASPVNFDRDEELIRRLVEGRAPVSTALGVCSPKLELFHLLYENAGDLWYLPEHDLLAATEQDEDVLHVYDLIGPVIPRWAEIEGALVNDPVRSAVFHFLPDRLGLEASRIEPTSSNRLHVVPGEDLLPPVAMVPATAHA